MERINYIIVPDGLAANEFGEVLPTPSFVFRWVLDWVIENAQPQDVIYLAPANKFGGEVSEQATAKLYLNKISNKIITFESDQKYYIDTRGNANLLKEFLKSQKIWPLEKAVLVSYYLHLFRARLVFKNEGFIFDCVSVRPSSFHSEKIVPRLWYYHYLTAHKFYEFI